MQTAAAYYLCILSLKNKIILHQEEVINVKCDFNNTKTIDTNSIIGEMY